MHSGVAKKRMPADQDPHESTLAKHFQKHKKVEKLMDKLADYMAGDIPE